MFGKCFKHLLFITVIFSGLCSWAQDGAFTIEFTEKKVSTNNTGIIDAYVKIANTSQNSLEGVFDVHSSHEDLYMTQRKTKTITLAANDSIFIPVKAIVSTSAAAGNQSTIEAVFTASGGGPKSAFLPVLIRERKQARMILLETNLIYENIGDSLSIPIRISNEGNTAQKIAVVIRFPDFISKNGLENNVINVRPFTDTIVMVKKKVNREVLNQENFSITVTALFNNGDLISNGTIRASSIKQDRRYVAPNSGDSNQVFQQANQATASYQRNSDNTAAYFLYANAQAEINKGRLQANLDVNWWDTSNQVFLRNTWLTYQEGSFGAQAGSITKFLDINLIGRGAEAFYNFNKSNGITAGAIDKSFNLFDSNNVSMGQSAWATYTHTDGTSGKGYNATLIYDNDDYYKTKNYLASASTTFLNKTYLNLRIDGAISNASAEVTNESKPGGAGEIQANGTIKKFFYNSTNYISSGYFSGMKKGVVNLNERLNLSLEKYTLWAVYNQLTVMPQVFGNQYSSTDFSNTRYDLGIIRRFNSLTLSLAPSYYTETRNEKYLSDAAPIKYTLNAERLNLGINYYHLATKQNVTLSFEGGFLKSNVIDDKQFHFKTNLNYNWKFLNVLAFYQYNNFYLGEIISNIKRGNTKENHNLTISPNAQVPFLNNKLRVIAGVTYTENNMINSLQLNGRMDYDITKDFSVFLYNFYSELTTTSQRANTLQFGITKRFNPVKIDRTRSDLEVYIYYDTTGKGPSDPVNMPAINQLVIIDGKAFRTNGNGMIKYRSLPAGNYEIRPINSNEWHAHTRTITTNGDMRVDIGLNKTATIKGSLSYFATDKSFQINRKTNGLSIIAIDDSGNVFNTKTDENGNFTLYIPKGVYTITLEKNGISDYVEMEDNNQQVEAVPNEIKEVKFKLTIKEKRVETKKFSSRGFPSLPAPEKDDKKKKK